MSEMTMPDTETDQDKNEEITEALQEEAADTDAQGTDEAISPALQSGLNPEGNPDDDRMGAPAMMPD